MERQRNVELYGTRKKPKRAVAQPASGPPMTETQAGHGRARPRMTLPLNARAPPLEAAL